MNDDAYERFYMQLLAEHQRKMAMHINRIKWNTRIVIVCAVALVLASLYRAWMCMQ